MLLVAVCTMVQVWTAEKQHFFCCFWKTMEKINYFFPLFLKNSKRILLPFTPAASYIRPIRNDSKTLKMIKTLAHGYSSVRVLSGSYPMNTNMTRFRWFLENLCVLVLWTKVVSALEGLTYLHLKNTHGPSIPSVTHEIDIQKRFVAETNFNRK